MQTPYPDSVRYLYALGNEFKSIKFGLDRIRTVLDALGNPHQALRVIHVAGTNGKGSTCAMIESAVRHAGGRTGLYTSPHLAEPTERIRIDGQPVTADDFSWAFSEVHAAAERLLSEGTIDMHPTYFETVTSMAYLLFRKHFVETVVLETGMGGRLDATNVVDPLLSVITPIDLDHEKFLGDTVAEIAFEKAGILKPGRPAVTSRQHTEAKHVLETRAAELGVSLTDATAWRVEDLHLHAFGSHFVCRGPRTTMDIECPLIGAHQVENTLTAVAALDVVGVDEAHIREGIAATSWPGRLEIVGRKPDIFLDGAHNPAGARALAGYIRHFHQGRRVWMIFGAMRDKDLSVIGHSLFPLVNRMIFTAPDQARAFQPAELRTAAQIPHAELATNIEAALAVIPQIPAEDVLFITGSLYLVGEARALLVG